VAVQQFTLLVHFPTVAVHQPTRLMNLTTMVM